jgi:hypothetical protein
MSTTGTTSEPLSDELGLVPIQEVCVDSIRPSPENAQLYRPVTRNDPEIVRLAESIKRHGILEPLIITADFFLVSGHRRYCAARLARLDLLFPAPRAEYLRAAEFQALKLLATHWPIVRDLASELQRKGKMTGAEVADFVKARISGPLETVKPT